MIGWIEEHHLRDARNAFHFAIGIHPKTGRHVSLEGNTDFDDRVNVIANFHQDPMTSRQHLGLNKYRWLGSAGRGRHSRRSGAG